LCRRRTSCPLFYGKFECFDEKLAPFQINQLRQRVSEYMGKFTKSKRGGPGKMKIAGHGGVGAVAAAFK